MFNVTQYTGQTFNSADLLNFLSNVGIMVSQQFQTCQTTQFLYSLDNRFSDPAFLSGTVANLGTQVGTLVGYYVLGTTYNMPIFTTLFTSSSLYSLYSKLYVAIVALQFQTVGLTATQFLLSLVSYKSSGTSSKLSAS